MFTSTFRPRRSVIPLITELSFAEDVPVSPDAQGGQGGGGSAPTPSATPTSAVDPAQLKQIVSDAFGSGISEQRDRDIAKFQKPASTSC